MKKLLALALSLITTFATAQSWQPMANLPSGRHHPVSFALNGKGYAVTGTNSFSSPTKDFYQYDPASDSWSTLNQFPGLARSFAIGIALNGKGYLGFGATQSQYLNDFWSYDPQLDKWTQLSSCPCSGRRHPAMVSIGDKIYVGLGDDATGNLRDWWMYHVPSNSWTQLINMPGAARHHPFQFQAGGYVFAGLGHGGPNVYNDWFKLDTATNSWSFMQDFPGEGRVAGTQFDWNGDGFVLSGDGDNHSYMSTGEMWRYRAASDSWTQFPPHPGISRWAPGSFVIGDEVFFFGGYNRANSTYPQTAFKFDLAAATVSLGEEEADPLSVYPNPAGDMIYWETHENITEVHILGALGKLVLTIPARAGKLDISTLSDGIYLLKFIDTDERPTTVKIVKQ